MAPDRRRRRPRLDPDGLPSAAVMLKLRPADYDKAWAVARHRRESIQWADRSRDHSRRMAEALRRYLDVRTF